MKFSACCLEFSFRASFFNYWRWKHSKKNHFWFDINLNKYEAQNEKSSLFAKNYNYFALNWAIVQKNRFKIRRTKCTYKFEVVLSFRQSVGQSYSTYLISAMNVSYSLDIYLSPKLYRIKIGQELTEYCQFQNVL